MCHFSRGINITPDLDTLLSIQISQGFASHYQTSLQCFGSFLNLNVRVISV